MLKYLFLSLTLLFGLQLTAQEKLNKFETVVIQTSAECGACKDRLEEALNYTKGVVFAELDLDTKKMTVKYNTKKLTADAIRVKIAATGYDADNLKANAEALENLPACCKPGGMK